MSRRVPAFPESPTANAYCFWGKRDGHAFTCSCQGAGIQVNIQIMRTVTKQDRPAKVIKVI